MAYVVHCLECRGRPTECDTFAEREQWVEAHRLAAPDHPLHLYIQAPKDAR